MKVKELIEKLKLEDENAEVILSADEEGNLSKVLKQYNYDVYSTDKINRGYGDGQIDFLKSHEQNLKTDILTNPPYKYAKEFVEKALEIQAEGYYTILRLIAIK